MRGTLIAFFSLDVLMYAAPVQAQNIADSGRSVLEIKDMDFNPETTLIAAQAAYEQEDFSLSLKLYQQILLRNPDHLEARIGAGDAMLALNQGRQAFAIFEALSKIQLSEDDRLRADIGLVLAHIALDDEIDPETRLIEALSLSLEDPRLWNKLGQICDAKQDWMRALDSYVNAMKLGGARSSTINNMGMSLLHQGRYDEAILKFEQAITIKPGKIKYENNLRMALILQKKFDAAFENTHDSEQAILLNDAGYIALQQRDLPLARVLLEKAVMTSPVYFAKAQRNLDQVKLWKIYG